MISPLYKGSGVGIDVLPALVGVGYICGAKVSAICSPAVP